MQNQKSQEVTKRFFEVLAELVELGHLHFISDFYTANNINSGNIFQLRRNMSKDILQLEWLTVLVEKHHVSANYLLTGKGEHFTKKLNKIERPPRRKYNKDKKSIAQSQA